jgi:hypothetical protein
MYTIDCGFELEETVSVIGAQDANDGVEAALPRNRTKHVGICTK